MKRYGLVLTKSGRGDKTEYFVTDADGNSITSNVATVYYEQ